MQLYTVVSEKKGTPICELILERYIYLSNTQKQLKIANYFRNKSSLEFYLVQWCLFETSRIIIIEVRDFASLCIKIVD